MGVGGKMALPPGPDPGGLKNQMRGAHPVGHTHTILAPAIRCKFLFETPNIFTEDIPPAPENVLYSAVNFVLKFKITLF